MLLFRMGYSPVGPGSGSATGTSEQVRMILPRSCAERESSSRLHTQWVGAILSNKDEVERYGIEIAVVLTSSRDLC